MPPPPPSSALLSRPHLAYLHASLGLTPPIRPDARAPTSFRALGAETDLLAGAHGSARVCFADGTEAVVGVRAEVERAGSGGSDEEGGGREWVEVGVEMQGTGVGSEDEGGLVFLEQMLREGLVADGHLSARLALGKSWHWRLFVDILLLSPPHTYPLPLLSLTTHLALLNTRLPAPISSLGEDEDPLFNDDWAAAQPLYPSSSSPPATVLAMAVGPNIFFDPLREELAVADVVLSVTFSSSSPSSSSGPSPSSSGHRVNLLALRIVEPPGSRLAGAAEEDEDAGGGVWRKRRGGVGRDVLRRMVDLVVRKGGVGEEVLAGLEGWV